MKIAMLNMTHNGSTGKIMLQIAECARSFGNEVKTFTPVVYSKVEKMQRYEAENHFVWGTQYESALHYYFGSTLGLNGCFSFRGTKKLIAELNKFKPDIIHLHNLHSFCINLPLLFKYIKRNSIKVVWTLHDCWAFTGQCPYFTMINCDKWRNQCYNCPQLGIYPKSLIDNSKNMYLLKKKWFTNLDNVVLVTPSLWLAELVKQSFLKNYPIKVINNGIDLKVFKPTMSDFRAKHNIPLSKKILLGVTFGWNKRKGLDVFLELSNRLNDDLYQIVLVGTSKIIDENLPDNIISINKTNNQGELAEIYSAADLFVNPTREDNYPTVNMESLACGTPVITFRTGGSPEIIDSTCGSVVECDDIDSLVIEIERICTENVYSKFDCLSKAKNFDMNDKFKEYVELYEDCTYRA